MHQINLRVYKDEIIETRLFRYINNILKFDLNLLKPEIKLVMQTLKSE